jgi:phosphoribosylamine--glycine ligase
VLVPDKIPDGVHLYYGDVSMSDTGAMLLGTSRAIGVVALGESVNDSEQLAQEVCEKITGPVRFREDIATVESIQKRVDLMQKLRGM